MIRGGHVDATFLGTLQVDEEGNIANWIIPGKMLAGMGGAMDLVTGAKVVYIVSEHCAKDGSSKLMKRCTFPLTGAKEADVIITERALFRRHPEKGWVLEEVACGYTLDDIAACTDMAYTVADDVRLEAFGAPAETARRGVDARGAGVAESHPRPSHSLASYVTPRSRGSPRAPRRGPRSSDAAPRPA